MYRKVHICISSDFIVLRKLCYCNVQRKAHSFHLLRAQTVQAVYPKLFPKFK